MSQTENCEYIFCIYLNTVDTWNQVKEQFQYQKFLNKNITIQYNMKSDGWFLYIYYQQSNVKRKRITFSNMR